MKNYIIVLGEEVRFTCETIEKTEYGWLVDRDFYFGKVEGDPHQVIEVQDIPLDAVNGKYLYNATDGFRLNPAYAEKIDVIKQETIDAYTLELIEGGLL